MELSEARKIVELISKRDKLEEWLEALSRYDKEWQVVNKRKFLTHDFTEEEFAKYKSGVAAELYEVEQEIEVFKG